MSRSTSRSSARPHGKRRTLDIPEQPTEAMTRAAAKAIAVLGPFPVPDTLHADMIRESISELHKPLPEIRDATEARKAVERMIGHHRGRMIALSKSSTPASFIKRLKAIAPLAKTLAVKLRGFDRAERNAAYSGGLSGWVGHGGQPFPKLDRLREMGTDGVPLGNHRLALRDILPHFASGTGFRAHHPDGALVSILLRLAEYYDLLAEQVSWDLTPVPHPIGAAAGKKPRRPRSIEYAKWDSPMTALVREGWSIFERCANVTPTAYVNDAGATPQAGRKKTTTLQYFLQLVHEAATGVPAGEELIAPNHLKKLAAQRPEENRLRRRLHDLYLRDNRYDAADLWALVHPRDRWGPKPKRDIDVERVPADVAAEARAIHRRLLAMHLNTHAPQAYHS